MPEDQKFVRVRNLALSVSILSFLLLVFGGIIRVTGAGAACPDWPLCNGQLLPGGNVGEWSHFAHRLLSLLALPIFALNGYVAYAKHRDTCWLLWPAITAFTLFLAQAILGALSLSSGENAGLSAVHFGLALLTLAASTTETVLAFVLVREPQQKTKFSFETSFSKQARATFVFLFLVLLSGVYVAMSQATYACTGWPLCNGELIPSHPLGWINVIHRLIVAGGGIFMLLMLRKAWRSQRSQIAILSAASLLVVLYFSQAFVGALKVSANFPSYLLGLHEATSAVLWVSAIVLLVLMGLSNRSEEDEIQEGLQPHDNRQRWRDFLALTKPIIVALLLVTTYTGMVVGIGEFPGLQLTFWTLFAGALAAGGAGAVNQYIDRELDQQMTRTAQRPLASGRLSPAEGLAYALSLLVISFYLYMGFVNMLAALLALAGMIYYIFLYSIWLKRATIQNIVIGGGAGAIPPLVGWAATTGSLDWFAALLFAIIFMWTPPHFWALALVRTKDYARAGIPMLPVVRGEEYTRRQILIYTFALVGLTLLLPLFDFAGNIYLISALLMGLMLIYVAWKVWKDGGNAIAWRMYRYSSMYLAFLFLALVVDSLIG